jgi:ATP-dependent RNA helicase RhlE
VLVFTRTKHGANRLTKQLQQDGVEAAAIHGNKSQSARTQALSDFKNFRIRALVATEVASRGLDIKELPHVVNYELPNVPEDYVHRIGRTGRAGATGVAVSLVSADEAGLLKDIERLLRKPIPQSPVPPFTPIVSRPDDRLAHAEPKRYTPRAPQPAQQRHRHSERPQGAGNQHRREHRGATAGQPRAQSHTHSGRPQARSAGQHRAHTQNRSGRR